MDVTQAGEDDEFEYKRVEIASLLEEPGSKLELPWRGMVQGSTVQLLSLNSFQVSSRNRTLSWLY